MRTESSNNFHLNYWFGRVWLSMYFAWITGAICVDSFSVFSDLPTSTYISSSAILCLLTITTMFVLHANRDVVFSLTFIWFTSWIIVHNKSVKEAYVLIITSIIVLSIILIATVITFALNIKFIINRYRGIESEPESESESESKELNLYYK
ncbi:hypothetical protein K502DRAFT_349406 [Neoconidiobolus thromboides FSU 785]|nr:hypothetical protein K502DRAFT_349406 [Neoconidiobolus thromboides FSU 785]